MGEARRRKQILGSDYGKKVPHLKIVSQAFHLQLEKFFQAWEEYLSQQEFTLKYFSSQPKTFQKQKEQWKVWLQNYLKPYHPEDKEKLLAAFIFNWYKQISDDTSKRNSETFVDLSMELTFMSYVFYQLACPYLSEDLASELARPLQSFYEMVLKDDVDESMEDEKMNQEAKYLKELLKELSEN